LGGSGPPACAIAQGEFRADGIIRELKLGLRGPPAKTTGSGHFGEGGRRGFLGQKAGAEGFFNRPQNGRIGSIMEISLDRIGIRIK
jgi:hypothetical protein